MAVIKPNWDRDAEVVRVIDADTIDVRCDLGFYDQQTVRIRLEGVNAPEVSTAAGKAARDYVKKLLPPGTPIRVRTWKDPKDSFRRWLGLIEIDGVGLLGEHLLQKGMAVPYVDK